MQPPATATKRPINANMSVELSWGRSGVAKVCPPCYASPGLRYGCNRNVLKGKLAHQDHARYMPVQCIHVFCACLHNQSKQQATAKPKRMEREAAANATPSAVQAKLRHGRCSALRNTPPLFIVQVLESNSRKESPQSVQSQQNTIISYGY